jgi:integrase
MFALALDGGLRQGELLALEWPDVDLEAGTVQVSRSLVESKKNGESSFRVKEPKSKAGRRIIFVAPETIATLREHQKHMLAEGNIGKPVFCSADGNYLFKSNVRKTFRSLIKRAKVPSIRFHDTRHTSVSLLLSNGTNIKVLSKRIGHSDISTTLRIYAHLMPDDQERVAKTVQSVLYG